MASRREEFTARYLVESAGALDVAAETIAGEQSSGTFLTLAAETAELKERSRARVVSIAPLPDVERPTLASAHVARRNHAGSCNRGVVEIAFPIANIGTNIPTLMATIAGNLFELGDITGLRLLDVDFPDGYASAFPGPKFGVTGTRDFAGVHDRPLIGTIIKPSIGLTPQQTAETVDALCSADIDFIKDDELIADPPYGPFEARLNAVMPVIARHADRMGRKPMYAINISGTIDEMQRRHDMVLAAGGTCVMVCVNWTGFSAVQHLRSYTELPIHGHRNGWGIFTRHPWLGMSFTAYQKIWRLTGVDQLHVNALRNKFWEDDDSVIESARACLAPLAGSSILPVFSSGQWAGQAPETYARVGSIDLLHLAGGGIIGHPGGIAAGVASLREGWEAAIAGIDLATYAADHPALRAAIAKFGGRNA